MERTSERIVNDFFTAANWIQFTQKGILNDLELGLSFGLVGRELDRTLLPIHILVTLGTVARLSSHTLFRIRHPVIGSADSAFRFRGHSFK